MLGRQLRDRIAPARLADRPDHRRGGLVRAIGMRAENLAGREGHHPLDVVADRQRPAQRIDRAQRVDLQRRDRLLAHRVDARHRGAMHQMGRTEFLDRRRQRRLVGHVAAIGLDALDIVAEHRARRIARIIVIGRDLVAVHEQTGKVRADEAGSAGDENPLVLKHALRLRNMVGPLSTRTITARPRRRPQRPSLSDLARRRLLAEQQQHAK